MASHNKLHATEHVDGTDDIQDATSGQKGLATAAQITKLDGVATGADVTGDNAPQAHNTSHQSGGGDAIKLDDLAAPDDNTDLDVSTSAHGLCPKLNNDAATYLNGQGSFTNPAADTNVVNAAGATPVDTDVAAWANDTEGIVVGTGGRVWKAFKNATDVYYVELTAL